jgi:hypothetical protein
MAKKYFKKILAYMERMILSLQKISLNHKTIITIMTNSQTRRFYTLVESDHTVQGKTVATSHDLDYLLSLRTHTKTWVEAKAFYKDASDLDLFYKYPCSGIMVYKSYKSYLRGADPITVRGLGWW